MTSDDYALIKLFKQENKKMTKKNLKRKRRTHMKCIIVSYYIGRYKYEIRKWTRSKKKKKTNIKQNVFQDQDIM